MGNAATTFRYSLMLLVIPWLATGCRSPRLPAIDPTGERIFLPAPASTTLTTPDLSGIRLPSAPQPAFTQPADPAPCADPLTGAPDGGCQPLRPPTSLQKYGPKSGTQLGRLVLMPGSLVAPVGTEVVLLAGLCDPDGYYLVNQPVEWLLSQESVGNFVDVGEPGSGWIPPMFNRGSKKVGSNFAIGRTAAKTAVYTRGTAATNDDFLVKRGQNWVSLTSPTEGVSHVTVWAPNADGWDLRRQTATVHWVDAQWELPPPTVVRAGQTHTLKTRIRRTSGAATQGWLVRYEITDGPPAEFLPARGQVAEVPVDANGEASVEMAATSQAPGTTRVRIQIVRPATARGQSGGITVGEGWVTVTWSAAGLTVNVVGPAKVGVGETLTFRVEVANPGDLYARNVVLRDVRPPTLEFLNSTPAGQTRGDYHEWSLGDLAPREARIFTVNCRAVHDGAIRYCFRASGRDDLQTEGCADVNVFTSQLSLQVSGPETATVGDEVTFRIEITNTGDTPLTNVALLDQYDPGLRHAGGQTGKIERLIGTLGPREKRSDLAVTFNVVTAGRHCHTVTVSADGGHSDAVQRCVVATAAAAPPADTPAAPQARLSVRVVAPPQMRVGDEAVFVIEIRNISTVPATNLRITQRFDAALDPLEATTGAVGSEAGQAISWNLREIAAGTTDVREVKCRAVQAAQAAGSEVIVTTDQGLQETGRTTTVIAAAAAAPGVDLTPPMPPNGTGAAGNQLQVNVISASNPSKLGQTHRFLISLYNDRSETDRNIAVAVTLPDGVAIHRISAPGIRHRIAGNVIRFDPIPTLAAGASLRPPLEIELVPAKAGKLAVTVQVESFLSRQTIEARGEGDVTEN
jgi:uncharacterized repeat protein (TIGR01451 family)